jgi:hypothetical protein
VKWADGAVTVEDSVSAAQPVSGKVLRDRYLAEMPALTLGLIRARENSLWLGPIELLRFGKPAVTKAAVEWPIEGGLLARSPGGRWRISAAGDRIVAKVEGYRPLLPAPIYAMTQLQAHHLLTRLFLLRVRGREPMAGVPARPQERLQAAAVDVAFCLTLARVFGSRPRVRLLIGIAAGYHVACWSISGRTLGGMVMRQRVVAVDGSRLTPMQSLARLAALPASWVLRRPVHDAYAGTGVISSTSPPP